MLSRRLLLFTVFAALLAATGCRDGKIATYRVPKESPPPAAVNAASGAGQGPNDSSAAPNMASTAVPTANTGDLTWTAPASWQSRAASAMRKATFILGGDTAGEQAELAVTAFPGDVGGNLANVNRWRTQLQLPPIVAAELATALAHIDIGGLHVDFAELLGPAPADGKPRQRVLGAIVPFNGATWFFKLTGPDALVSAKKAEFLGFLQTLQPAR